MKYEKKTKEKNTIRSGRFRVPDPLITQHSVAAYARKQLVLRFFEFHITVNGRASRAANKFATNKIRTVSKTRTKQPFEHYTQDQQPHAVVADVMYVYRVYVFSLSTIHICYGSHTFVSGFKTFG